MRVPTIAASVLLSVVALAAGCSRTPAPTPEAAVTIAPLQALVRALLPDGADVHLLAPPGASPHSYEPKPEDARAAEGAKVLISVAGSLDGWTADLTSKRHWQAIEAVPETMRLEYLHDHAHSGSEQDHIDPHFWLDPMTVIEVLPGLAAALNEAGAVCPPERVVSFAQDVFDLHSKLEVDLAPLRDKSFVVFHDSMRYFFNRYGLKVAGVIERSPGKEPTPQEIQGLIRLIVENGAIAIATEPQFPEAPAATLAEASGVPMIVLDPIGGVPGRMTYRELLEFNAASLLAVAPK
jgi:zinc transport system substrate-binding protein